MKRILSDFPVLSVVLGSYEQDEICGCQNSYATFELKARGSTKARTIDAPCPHLKRLQRALLDRVLVHVEPHDAAMAFVLKKSVAMNARRHHGASHLFTTDIRSFFSSITATHVLEMLEARFRHLTPMAIAEISLLVTHKARLPQGAPTSPHLANLVMYDFDERCHWLCSRLGAVYTRYADDISISAADANVLYHLEAIVRDGLNALGLEMHPRKTRHFGPEQRKIVTGLDIGGARIRPTRAFRKKAAALVRMTAKYPNKMERHRNRIYGHLAFWYSVDPADPELHSHLGRMGLNDWARRASPVAKMNYTGSLGSPERIWDNFDAEIPF